MVSLHILVALLTAQLSSASPFNRHDSLSVRQATTNGTSLSGFVGQLSLERSGANDLLQTLQGDKDMEAFLAGREFDKSQLAKLSCEALRHTFRNQVVASAAREQIIQESWLVSFYTNSNPLLQAHISTGQKHAG